ncbi:MAG: hypothetical protein WC943_11310 [Elusimicrobiota bacterium]|jgi:arsenate reductase
MASILFVCDRNACRSQIAEALCRRDAPKTWLVASAGVEPSAQEDPRAVESLRRHGLVVSVNRPKGFEALPEVEWDVLVFLGTGAMPALPEARRTIQWPVAGPDDTPALSCDEIVKDLEARVADLLLLISEPSKT